MNISNLGRLIGAGLLALGLHTLTPGVAAGDAGRLDTGAVSGGNHTAPASRAFDGALVEAQTTLSPADGRRAIESPE